MRKASGSSAYSGECTTWLWVRIDRALVLQSKSLPLKKKASPRIWATASKWLVHLSGASRAGLRDGEKKQKKRTNKWGGFEKKKKNTPTRLLAIRWQWRIYSPFFLLISCTINRAWVCKCVQLCTWVCIHFKLAIFAQTAWLIKI